MKKILFIEDDEISRIALAISIENEGYIVRSAENGLEGIKNYKNERFDIVITDLKMPKLDGYGVRAKIREIEKKESRERIPIIIISGQFELDSIDDSNIHFVQKPIDIGALLQKLMELSDDESVA